MIHFSEKQIRIIVTVVKSLYLFIFLLAVAILFLSFVHSLERFMSQIFLGLPAVVSGTIFFGLHKRKAWIIPIIVLVSAFSLVTGFLSFPDTLSAIIGKWFGIFWAMFMLYFFTRKEVREYFGAKGIFVF